MTDNERCPICRYQKGVEALASRLGIQRICFECFEAKAEDMVTIWRYDQVMSREFLKECTCWHGPQVGYLGLKESLERFTHQMPVPVPRDEDEEEDEQVAQDLVARLEKVRQDIEREQAARKERKSWFRLMVDWFRTMFYRFDEAASAGL